MRNCRGLRRRKAPFGTQEAATLAAAGIQAATTIAMSIAERNQARDNAKMMADTTIQNTEKETKALRKQNEVANELQAKNQEFISAQNEENRDIQKTMQMNLQMMAAKQNEADRLASTRTQVKCGGSSHPLRGSLQRNKALSGSQIISSPTNMDFQVTDGGYVVPEGKTATGDLYQIKGQDHDHYHKTKNGKKSGVGIKFENGEVIEGEGNQNGQQGEFLLVTPYDAKFISRHSIRGFNPAKSIRDGMAPEQAFAIQEQIKDKYNIPDDGQKAENGKSVEDKTLFHKQWLEGRTKQLEKAVKNHKQDNFVRHPLMAFSSSTQKTVAENLKNDFIKAITNVDEYYPNTINYVPNDVKNAVMRHAHRRIIANPDDTLPDPKKEWTIDEIKQLRTDGKLKLNNEEQRDLDRYNDEFLLHLFNDVAYNVNNSNEHRLKANTGYQIINDLLTTNDMNIPNMSQDTSALTIGTAERSQLRCGGRRKAKCGNRTKASNGYYNFFIDEDNPDNINTLGLDEGYAVKKKTNKTTVTPDTDLIPDNGYSIPTADTDLIPDSGNSSRRGKENSGLTNFGYQLIGAGITGLGNVVGTAITNAGNRMATRLKNQGINTATGIALDGYDKLHGINYSSIKNADYKAGHAMPAIRLARYNIAPQLAEVSRSLARQRTDINRNTRSSAAALNRLNRAETNAYDMRSKLYGAKANQEEAIHQKNIDAINTASLTNAKLDTQMNAYKTNSLLEVAKYNADVDNNKTMLKTNALVNRNLSIANNNAGLHQGNMSNIANAFSNTAQGFGNTFAQEGQNRTNMDYIMLGSDMKTTLNMLDTYSKSNDPAKRKYALRMKRQLNIV